MIQPNTNAQLMPTFPDTILQDAETTPQVLQATMSLAAIT
jgi:hypothetical protein